jgi:molybdopterin converting factor small subunit
MAVMTRNNEFIVEFFGLARHRSGCVAGVFQGESVGEVLKSVFNSHPELQPDFAARFLVSINGREFTSDPATPLSPGDRILLLSADAGG